MNNSTLSTEQVIGDDDLLKQILIHLPAKPLFRFKLISKRRCSLISDHQFHLQWIPPKSASSLFLRRDSYSKFNFITLIPKNGTKKKNLKSLKSLNFVNNPSVYMNLSFDPSVSIHYKVHAVSSDCRGPVC
ncbi:hypothetical protein ACSBR1_026124 [Camellia fascicularis]